MSEFDRGHGPLTFAPWYFDLSLTSHNCKNHELENQGLGRSSVEHSTTQNRIWCILASKYDIC